LLLFSLSAWIALALTLLSSLQVIGIARSDERGHEAVQQLKEEVPGAKISLKVIIIVIITIIIIIIIIIPCKPCLSASAPRLTLWGGGK
jgi:hypothetical protein